MFVSCFSLLRAGGIRIKPFHGNKKQRMKNLYKVQNNDGILITTYGINIFNIFN